MPPFRQAPPDADKAARDGVTNYIPSRLQVNINHACRDCNRTAKWDITADGEHLFACDFHRTDYIITATVYTEKRIR